MTATTRLSSNGRLHADHTEEHHQACQQAARALLTAADYCLEATQYTWTPITRGTIMQALEKLEKARELLAQAQDVLS